MTENKVSVEQIDQDENDLPPGFVTLDKFLDDVRREEAAESKLLEEVLTPLRRKRLLLLAARPNAWHKRFYSQYCVLIQEGLVSWQLGTAFLTPEGQRELLEILTNEQVP